MGAGALPSTKLNRGGIQDLRFGIWVQRVGLQRLRGIRHTKPKLGCNRSIFKEAIAFSGLLCLLLQEKDHVASSIDCDQGQLDGQLSGCSVLGWKC